MKENQVWTEHGPAVIKKEFCSDGSIVRHCFTAWRQMTLKKGRKIVLETGSRTSSTVLVKSLAERKVLVQ